MAWKDLTQTQRDFLSKFMSKSILDMFTDRTQRPENVEKVEAFETFLKLDQTFRRDIVDIPPDYAERGELERQADLARKQCDGGDFTGANDAMTGLIEQTGRTARVLKEAANEIRSQISTGGDIDGATQEETLRLNGLQDRIATLLADPIPGRGDLATARGLLPGLSTARDEVRESARKRGIRNAFDLAFSTGRDRIEAASRLDPAPYAKAAIHPTLVQAIADAGKLLQTALTAAGSDDEKLHVAGREAIETWLKGPNAETHKATGDQQLEERKRLLGEITSKVNGHKAEMERLGKLPPDTAEADELQRLIPFQAAQVSRFVTADDLDKATTALAALEDSIAAMKLEEAEITKAGRFKQQVLEEYARLQPRLVEARGVHAVTDAFAPLVTAFANADYNMSRRLATKEYERAFPTLDTLTRATTSLLAAKPAFLLEEQRREDALDRIRQFAQAWHTAQNTPLTKPEVKTASDRCKALASQIEAVVKSKDWAGAITAYEEGLRLANLMISEAGACTTLRTDQQNALNRFVAVRDHANPIIAHVAVTPEFTQRCKDLAAAIDEFVDVYNNVKDIPRCLQIATRLEQLDSDLEALDLANTNAINARNAVRTEWQKSRAKIDEAKAIKPATDKMLGLQRALNLAFDAYVAADETGAADCLDKLNAAIAAADLVLAEKVEDAKAAATAEANFRKREKQVRKAGLAAQNKATACAPDLDALLEQLKDAWGAAQFNKNNARFLEGLEDLERVAAVAIQIDNGEAGANLAMDQRRLEVDRRYDTTLIDQINDILGYEDVTTDMAARRQQVDDLSDDVENLRSSAKYHLALAKLDQLEPLVAELTRFKGTHDQLVVDRDWVNAEWGRIQGDITTADAMKAVDRQTAEAVAVYGAARKACGVAYDEKRFADSRAAFAEMERAVAALVALKSQHDLAAVEEKKVSDAWALISADYDKAAAMRPLTPELAKLKTSFDKANSLFNKAYFGFDYPVALTRLAQLEKAVAALLAKQSDHDQAVIETDRKAGEAETALDTIDPGALKSKTAEEKLALLNDLRGQKKELTDKQRELQRKVYMAMDLDTEFLKVDEERRGRLIDTIRGDTELLGARDTWPTEDPSKKIALLTRTLRAECDIYGMPVPEVQTFSEPPGDLGSFNSSTNVIRINIHPEATFDDFYDTIDTIVHENAHNYQGFLVKKLQEGLIQPGDPEYVQALMFAANSEPWAYVTAEEDKDCYKKEPLEEHAWKTGGDVQKALKKPPVVG